MIRNRGGLLFPIALIVIGLLVLLANVGVLSSQALQRLADLWPLLLVIIGLQLILNHTLPRAQAMAIGWAATAVIVIGAVVYAALAPTTAFGTQHATSSQPLGGLSAGTLQLNYSAASVGVRAGGIGDRLYEAKIDYPAGENPPTISVDQQTGTIDIGESGNFGGVHLFGSSTRRLVLTLSTKVPWTINIGGGASNLQMDTRELQLRALEISGGATSVDARLGPAKGTVGVHITGGASNVALQLPSGSQWRVAVSGGVSGLTVNGQTSGGLGDFTKESGGYTVATNRFDISVSGGVSHLDLRTD
ncbi:MAG TPA: hypothetical protein VHW91_09775 [Candidatus Dormibacteraeota bacterium]|nr:hypothetical protein [Candidatus Dormibacteraeota bacterium]